ncbi:hypothetical protein [Alkaliphilus crotonatoxidans]
MAKITFPNEKISGRVNHKKINKIKREAILLENRFVCPLCFEADYDVIKCEFEKNSNKPMRYTGKCKKCSTIIQYNKETPRINL